MHMQLKIGVATLKESDTFPSLLSFFSFLCELLVSEDVGKCILKNIFSVIIHFDEYVTWN